MVPGTNGLRIAQHKRGEHGLVPTTRVDRQDKFTVFRYAPPFRQPVRLPKERIDVTGLWGPVEGYAVGALESPRASITTLSRHFGFDAVETEGVIRFVICGRLAAATVSPDDLVAARQGDVLELTHGRETELPQALKLQVARAGEDYEAAQVEARRIWGRSCPETPD